MLDRDEQEISQIISEGLDAILSGEKTLEEVLAAHPEQAEVIRSELEAASWLTSQQAEVSPRPGFVAASRQRVVERIRQEASSQNVKHSFFGMVWPQRLVYHWWVALSVLLIVFSGLGSVVSFSQNSLPGDELYQVKRAYEQVAISVAPGEAQRATLAAQFSRRRLDEAKQLINKGDYSAARFSLVEFEQSVNQAITHLQQVSDGQLNEKQSVAVSLQQDLSDSAEQLAQLAPSVPSEIIGVVVHARDTSISGVVMASRVIDEVNEKKPTAVTATLSSGDPGSVVPPVVIPTLIVPTNTWYPTSAPTVFLNPAPTATQVPADTVTAIPPPANTPEMTLTPTQVTATAEMTSTLVPSETPTDIPGPTDISPWTDTPVSVMPTLVPSDNSLPDTATPTSVEETVVDSISGSVYDSPTPGLPGAEETPSPIQTPEATP